MQNTIINKEFEKDHVDIIELFFKIHTEIKTEEEKSILCLE
jgi:hypothetical protein